MPTDFDERLREVEARYEQVAAEMAAPEAASDLDRLRSLGMAFSDLEEIVTPYRAYLAAQAQASDAAEMAAAESDPEMRAFLEGIAPAKRADRITKPLLVSQGANDPRVPLSESDQIVKAVRSHGVPVWYLVAQDEGHGFDKKSNTDFQRAVVFEFVRRFLLGEK